ncbi:MAG: 50S ribosomal protein L24 [Lentisphaeria bacterium]|jgi:large subunit ribosomal protein L24
MSKVTVKKDVEVQVISGANKGKAGKVLRVDREHARVWIQGVNMGKKAVRRSQARPQGGFEEIERPIHISNVMPLESWNARQARKGAAAADGGKN